MGRYTLVDSALLLPQNGAAGVVSTAVEETERGLSSRPTPFDRALVHEFVCTAVEETGRGASSRPSPFDRALGRGS